MKEQRLQEEPRSNTLMQSKMNGLASSETTFGISWDRHANRKRNPTVFSLAAALGILALFSTQFDSIQALPLPRVVHGRHQGASGSREKTLTSSYFAPKNASRKLDSHNTTNSTEAFDDEHKELRVCSVPNLLDITRLRSRETRQIFSAAIEDVELIREYYTEAMFNQGIVGGMSDLVELAYSYDWLGRGTVPMTTVEAGLGWVDDREGRRMERYISTSDNQPSVGTKQSDIKAFDASSNLFPWLVDRRSREAEWYVSHQNGRSEGEGKEPLPAEKLYTAAWTVSWGDTLPYFPPLDSPGAPLTLGDPDVLGPSWTGRTDPTTLEGSPEKNPERIAKFINPYPDVAQPGIALISALAPVYYTGFFDGYEYNDTYIATAGVDIALSSVSFVFGDLEDSLTEGSFAFLVDTDTFSVIAISQAVVDIIYPELTGNEPEREESRRGVPYEVGDTIFQPLVIDGESSVDSADWAYLQKEILATPPGDRGSVIMNITSTGETTPVTYYAAFDRWQYVSNWSLLVFAPVERVEYAINPVLAENVFEDSKVLKNDTVHHTVVLTNDGFLSFNVTAMNEKNPRWIVFDDPEQVTGTGTMLQPGESVDIGFSVDLDSLGFGNSSSSLSFLIVDNDYPDCFYSEAIGVLVSVDVVPFNNLNQLGAVRIVGYVLAAIIICLAAYCVWWVYAYRRERVVRASQPMFLVTIAFGSFLMAATIIPLSIDDGVTSERGCDIACMCTPWLFSVGFVTSFAALFSKLWRINKIFQSNRFQRVKVTEKDVLVPFAVLFVLNFALLLAWTIADPLVWDRKTSDTDPTDSYGRCIGHGTAHIYFLSAIVIIDVAALVLACFEAYKARGISDEYSETKFIAIAVGGWVQVVLIGVPLMFLVSGNPTADFFIKSCIIFTITLAMLLLIFVPKMLHEKTRDSGSNKRATQSAEVQRIMARATAYAHAAASAPANLETYRVSSLSNTNSQNSEIEASMEMNNHSSSTSSLSDGMGFRIIGSIETDQKKLAEVQDENKVLKRQLKREQREVERMKRLLAERGVEINGFPPPAPQHFLAPEGERLSGSTRKGTSVLTSSRVTFYDETKSGSLHGVMESPLEDTQSPPTPKRRLSPGRDAIHNARTTFVGLDDMSDSTPRYGSRDSSDTADDDDDGNEYEEDVKGSPDEQV